MEENIVIYNLRRVRKRLRNLDENVERLNNKIVLEKIEENKKDIDELRELIISNHKENWSSNPSNKLTKLLKQHLLFTIISTL